MKLLTFDKVSKSDMYKKKILQLSTKSYIISLKENGIVFDVKRPLPVPGVGVGVITPTRGLCITEMFGYVKIEVEK